MFTLFAQLRTKGDKKIKNLRKKGLIPAVIYGRGIETRSLLLEALPFEKIYQKAGESSLVQLVIDKEKPISVLIQDAQTDPLSDKIIHVDLHQVRETEKVTTEIELKFVGESKAIRELGGTLVRNLDRIKVEALPKNLIHEIEVDISKLTTFEDVIHVSNLKIPETIKILEKSDEVVALVQPLQVEEVAEKKTEEEQIKEIEKVREKKEEKEE